MQKIIIFLSSIVLLGTTRATLTQKLKEKLFEPKDCLPKLIENYTFSSAPARSIQSDENMLQLCPNLHESCCLKNNLNDLHQLVLDAISSLDNFQKQYVYLLDGIHHANQKNIDHFLKAFTQKVNGDDPEEVEEEEDEEVVRLKEALEYVNTHSSVIKEDLEAAIQLYISINSRYACALCNRENLFSFKNIHSRNPTVMLDLAQCKQIVSEPNLLSMFRIDNHTGYLYTIIRAMSFIEKGSSPTDTFLSAEELSNFPQLIRECQDGSNFINKTECQSLCMGLKFFNENPFYNIQKSIIAGSLLVDHYIKGQAKKDPKELNIEYEEYEKKIAKVFFLMPHLKSPYLVERFDKLFTWNSGWNIMNFEMNYELPIKKASVVSEDEFILRAVRKPQDLFEIVKKNVPYVEENSSRILTSVILLVSFFVLAN